MKCPKCGYLGFDTGERCRHCGYDFSLLTETAPRARTDFDGPLGSMSAMPGPPADPTLPLFVAGVATDDAPLVTVPAAPRLPLAVRRTPDRPKLRVIPRERVHEPALDFTPPATPEPRVSEARTPPSRTQVSAPVVAHRTWTGTEAIGARRIAALMVDHALLWVIDAITIYFTVRMAGLELRALRALPLVPLLAFLCLVKLTYFFTFTALGGQTLGKMLTGLRVVSDDHRLPTPTQAARRTLAAVLTAASAGIGYVPALRGPVRRAWHDRLAGTRVVRPEA